MACLGRYVKSPLFSFCIYMIEWDDALSDILPFKAKWDEQISIETLSWREEIYTNAYVPI